MLLLVSDFGGYSGGGFFFFFIFLVLCFATTTSTVRMIDIVLKCSIGFLFQVSSSSCNAAEKEAHALLLFLVPHMWKKVYKGFVLSVEEVGFLLHLSSHAAEMTKLKVADASVTNDVEGAPFRVIFHDKEVEDQFLNLSKIHHEASLIYRMLSVEHNYALRHGSQFGALFIGYSLVSPYYEKLQQLNEPIFLSQVLATPSAQPAAVASEKIEHSVVLFFYSPSSSQSATDGKSLESIRAARVAHSVRKQAVWCSLIYEEATSGSSSTRDHSAGPSVALIPIPLSLDFEQKPKKEQRKRSRETKRIRIK